ncbi:MULTISPECIES: SCO6745 family protein [unclassified Streptomyces]|uniref:SCO6745 family protein n=1 Tax=unclassified Streptomyces TaxID=2593676 RepID=UPI0022B5E98A|nr:MULTISPECIES: hypothetical protein [unclassified Streptomyces]MCZ7415783.1 hypothetical protein [Streptomyces sp. WMMC897]MCZ7434406.1 hypothetical protein [Streptomyces sp. WMMC1477]
MTTLHERAGRRCHNVLNPLHSTVYFAPETREEMGALGLTDWSSAYFAGRSAALGAVGPGTVAATFYSFSYDLIARHLPAAWETATPGQVLDARLRAADRSLRRLLGPEAIASPELAEAATLALHATEACERGARPLYAAHADLPVPEEPHLALWHAATLLREHRGDAHLAVLMGADLPGLDAQVTHTSSGKGMSLKWALETRGYTQDDWSAAQERLRARGLLDAEGELTDEGVALRRELEIETDRRDRAPYEHLGAAGVERLTELGTVFTGAVIGAGGFPGDLIGG